MSKTMQVVRLPLGTGPTGTTVEHTHHNISALKISPRSGNRLPVRGVQDQKRSAGGLDFPRA